ncbi:MAG: hypothetical protein LBM93_12545 [Oscillospiraceae bacterium]|jgi:hypothetical protein|nr:hypothetical protein [Oscillospiraceae bacterium]
MFEFYFIQMCEDAGIPDSVADKMRLDAQRGRCVLGKNYGGYGFNYPGTVLCEGLQCANMWSCEKYRNYLKNK